MLSGVYFLSILKTSLFDNHLPQRPANATKSNALQVLSSLSLNLVCEVKVALVKLVHPNVTILSSTGISFSLGVGCNGVQWTEVTTDTTNLLFEDLVIEASLELSLTCGL